jgi:RNA polymerase sigma factor (sigma-70 family)
MAARRAQLVHHLQRLAAASGPASDADLLERFILQRDEAAFAALVGRYAPMVLLVCRRMLADADAAEDALQATFLILARKASSIRRRDSLAAFLHGVACRVARKRQVRTNRHRMTPLEQEDGPLDPRPDPLSELTARELVSALDEEVARLPEVYQLPVVLCCLEGLSLEEAARRLGWTAGSVKGRLERGRKRLYDRLARRGLTLGTALSALEVSRGIASGAAIARAASVRAGVSARVTALAQGVIPGAGMWAVRTIAVVLLTVGVAAGAGLVLWRMPGSPPGGTQLGGAVSSPRLPAIPAAREDAEAPPDQAEMLPPGALARMGTLRFCSGHTLQSVAFSPDRKTLASGTKDGTVWLWEAATGKEIRRITESHTFVDSVAYSPDGKLLACRSHNNGIGLWDVVSGKEVRRLAGSNAQYPASFTGPMACGFRIAFSPDGKTLAAASGDLTFKDNAIRLWDVAGGKEIRRFQGHRGAVRIFAFAPDGKTLATGGEDRTIRLWDPETGKQRHLIGGAGGEVVALAYSRDGKVLASRGEDRAIRFWSAEGGKELKKLPVGRAVKSLLFVDASTLAWGDDASSIHLVDLKTDKEIRALGKHSDEGSNIWVSDLSLSPDGKTLASVGGGQDYAVHLWQVSTGKRLFPPQTVHSGRVEGVGFSPDGKTLFSASWDGTLRTWDPATGKQRQRWPSKVFCFAFSPDGKTLVAAAGGQFLKLIETASGRELWKVEHVGSGDFRSVAYAPDGKTVLAGGSGFDGGFKGVVYHFDARTGKEIRQFLGHDQGVQSVAFSGDGKQAASGGFDKTVRLWEVASGKELRRLQGHKHYVDAVAFSSDGAMLASVDAYSIRLWDAATGKELRRQDADYSTSYGASCVAFAPDGKTLASGEWGAAGKGVVRLREVATGKEICSWTGHRNRVSSLAFHPNGRVLASGGWDTLILVWDVTGREAEGRAARRLTGKDLDELWEHLADEDVPKAYRALWKLALAPEQAVPFLARRMRSAPVADDRRIAGLIRDLDDDGFAIREAATAELERLGDAAAPALQKVLEGSPSLEANTRIRHLLKKLQLEAKSQDRLRLSRAMQALEQSGTPAARDLLKHLAGGAAGAWQSRAAKAALQRLTRASRGAK